VSREDVTTGAQELGVELEPHIEFVIGAMRAVAPALGLDGSAAAGGGGAPAAAPPGAGEVP